MLLLFKLLMLCNIKLRGFTYSSNSYPYIIIRNHIQSSNIDDDRSVEEQQKQSEGVKKRYFASRWSQTLTTWLCKLPRVPPLFWPLLSSRATPGRPNATATTWKRVWHDVNRRAVFLFTQISNKSYESSSLGHVARILGQSGGDCLYSRKYVKKYK